MNIETNRRIAEQFNEAFNRGDLDAAASCFAEDCQNHGRKVGRAGVRTVTSRFPVDGGMLVGVQPTGRTFEVQHIHMYRVQTPLSGSHARHTLWGNDGTTFIVAGLRHPNLMSGDFGSGSV